MKPKQMTNDVSLKTWYLSRASAPKFFWSLSEISWSIDLFIPIHSLWCCSAHKHVNQSQGSIASNSISLLPGSSSPGSYSRSGLSVPAKFNMPLSNPANWFCIFKCVQIRFQLWNGLILSPYGLCPPAIFKVLNRSHWSAAGFPLRVASYPQKPPVFPPQPKPFPLSGKDIA